MPEYELVTYLGSKERKYRVLRPPHHAGIFSYIWVCLQSMYNFPNDLYYIDWRKFSTYYDPSVTRTDNVWEYYFEQPCVDTPPEPEEIIASGIWNEGDSGYCVLSKVTPEKRQKYHDLIVKYVRLLPHVREKVDSFLRAYDWTGKKVLGVHCRGTDSYLRQGVQLYLDEVALLEKDYDVIYVMTDELSYLQAMMDKFGKKVVFYEGADRSSTSAAVWDRPKSPYKAGEDPIVESTILANTNFIVCGRSNVSYYSQYLGLVPFLNVDVKHGNLG